MELVMILRLQILTTILNIIHLELCEGQTTDASIDQQITTTHIDLPSEPPDVNSPTTLLINNSKMNNNTAGNLTHSPTASVTPSSVDFSNTTPVTKDTPNGGVTVVLFRDWRFLVALLCLEVFAYCATLFIIFGMQNKRARGKRFGTFSWKGRKGNEDDSPRTIIA